MTKTIHFFREPGLQLFTFVEIGELTFADEVFKFVNTNLNEVLKKPDLSTGVKHPNPSRVYSYLHHILQYFEQVLHPAAGRGNATVKNKRNSKSSDNRPASPECYNVRGKLQKPRVSPAP